MVGRGMLHHQPLSGHKHSIKVCCYFRPKLCGLKYNCIVRVAWTPTDTPNKATFRVYQYHHHYRARSSMLRISARETYCLPRARYGNGTPEIVGELRKQRMSVKGGESRWWTFMLMLKNRQSLTACGYYFCVV